MSKFEYKRLSHHFKFTSRESKMNAPPFSVERVQKCVFNFEIYRILKKRPINPILPNVAPTFFHLRGLVTGCSQNATVGIPRNVFLPWSSRGQRKKNRCFNNSHLQSNGMDYSYLTVVTIFVERTHTQPCSPIISLATPPPLLTCSTGNLDKRITNKINFGHTMDR